MDSKEINNLADQYINFIKSNKQLMDMIKTETIDKESFKNYHVIDHDYIIQWKNLISYDKLTKKNKEEICDIIRKNNINSKKFNLENKKIYNKDGVNPMESFDIISDDVWKLFDKKNENSEFNGKVSILKGNKKIIIRFNENTYSVRYLTNDMNDLINEFIVNFNLPQNEEKKRLIIDEILKDNIYNWMKNINFNYHSKQFNAERNKVQFEIKQKSNNFPSTDIITFDTSNLKNDENCDLISLSNDSFIYSYSYKNNIDFISSSNDYSSHSDSSKKYNDFVSGLKSFLITMNDFSYVTVQKFEQTSNVCAVMRCLSMIEPLANYLMSPIKANQIYNKFQSTSLLNNIRNYFIELWSETKSGKKVFKPIILIKILEKRKNFKIKEEQDPILFLNLFFDYVNQRLNKFDHNIKFNFNNIEQKLQNKSNIDELKRIIDKSNSIIGELFYGLMIETYKCNNCHREFEKIKKFETIDIEYKEIIDQLNQISNSFAFIDMKNDCLDFIFLNKKLDNKKEKMEECPSCKKKVEIIKRKILEYPSYLIIRLKIGDYKEKEGFVNMNEQISSRILKFKEINDMEIYISDSLKKDKTNNKYEYELLSIICYLKDSTDNNKIKFISICKNIIDNDETWIYFMCNNENHIIFKDYDELQENLSKDNAHPYILFYKLNK